MSDIVRDELRDHYEYNWFMTMPQGDHLVQFFNGERLAPSELRRMEPVPSAYARDAFPLPAGYRLGYYNGTVYAYNATTGVVTDSVGVTHR